MPNTYSVIIPTLNEEVCLPILLDNLASQSNQDFEVVVIDGHSEDKTKTKVQKFKKELNLKFFEVKKRNVSYQRNFGAKKSTSNVLIFLDADTILPKNFIKKVKSEFDKSDPDLLTTYIRTDEKGIKPIETGTNLIFELTKIIGSPALYGSMIAVKKAAFNKVGGFNENMKYKEDTELSQKMFKAGYKYIILKNTYYKWSLRRFKKLGTIKTLQNYFLLNLNKSLDYQMGGHLFVQEAIKQIQKSRTRKIEKKINKFVENLLEKFKLQ